MVEWKKRLQLWDAIDTYLHHITHTLWFIIYKLITAKKKGKVTFGCAVVASSSSSFDESMEKVFKIELKNS